jgi:hypothetical protein
MMRKATGSVLGIIFFFAIMFSTVIPLQLYLKENKMLLINRENEVKAKDYHRELEDIVVLAYPTNSTSNNLIVQVQNKGPIPVVIEKVWIEDDFEMVECSLNPGQESDLGPFSIELEENSTYKVKVSTNRGRLFVSETGNLLYINGGWFTPTLGVSIQIANDKGKYYINLSNSTWSDTYETQGQDEGNLLVFFSVKTNGNYYLVCKKNNQNGPNLPGTPMVLEVSWPGATPIVFVYTSGLGL